MPCKGTGSPVTPIIITMLPVKLDKWLPSQLQALPGLLSPPFSSSEKSAPNKARELVIACLYLAAIGFSTRPRRPEGCLGRRMESALICIPDDPFCSGQRLFYRLDTAGSFVSIQQDHTIFPKRLKDVAGRTDSDLR